MKTTSPNRTVSIFGFICSAFGHHYVVTKKVTNHINEYKCSHCGKEVTDNAAGYLEVLTYKRKELNKCLSNFFQKKSRRISA